MVRCVQMARRLLDRLGFRSHRDRLVSCLLGSESGPSAPSGFRGGREFSLWIAVSIRHWLPELFLLDGEFLYVTRAEARRFLKLSLERSGSCHACPRRRSVLGQYFLPPLSCIAAYTGGNFGNRRNDHRQSVGHYRSFLDDPAGDQT